MGLAAHRPDDHRSEDFEVSPYNYSTLYNGYLQMLRTVLLKLTSSDFRNYFCIISDTSQRSTYPAAPDTTETR